jgi:hypothetical protein
MELMKTENPGRWRPGQSGNVNGRPVGSRHQFSGAFLRDLADVWQEHGRDTMLHTAKTQPATFFAVCARLIPADVRLTLEQTYGGLTPADYAILQAIKESLPAANSESPQAILEFVRDAVRAHAATKLIAKPRRNVVASSIASIPSAEQRRPGQRVSVRAMLDAPCANSRSPSFPQPLIQYPRLRHFPGILLTEKA